MLVYNFLFIGNEIQELVYFFFPDSKQHIKYKRKANIHYDYDIIDTGGVKLGRQAL